MVRRISDIERRRRRKARANATVISFFSGSLRTKKTKRGRKFII